MIVEENGKAYSVRTVQELQAMLQRDMELLNDDERALLAELIAETAEAPAAGGLLGTLSSIEWTSPPVEMETFVKDEYYLGRTCDSLYDRHMIDLRELFDSGGYHEAIWSGSIGCGKTFAASVGVCRVLYELSCMRDPHAAFHIAKGTPIHIVCFSVTEELAVKVAFDNIIEKIQASPYFTEKFGYRPGKKEYRFPNKITLAARATTDTSALGMNVISAFIDEGNFLPQPGKARRLAGEKDKAETIYNQLKRRMKSRFTRHGKLPGMMFVVSSKRRTDDFTSKLVRSSRADPTVAVFDYSLWEVKPDNYSSIRFKVFVGNEAIPSKILDDAEIARYVELAKDKENTALLDVPQDFRDDFERDLEASIRDIAGVATVSIAPFIQRREKIREAAEFGDQNGLAHPFSVVEFTPGVGGEFLWDKMVAPVRRKLANGKYETLVKPIINPDAVRHAHIDPSLVQDRTGVAVGHIAGYKEVTRRTAQHQTYLEKAPVIVVDLLLRVVPPVGDEILLGDVRDLIYQMRDHGYSFGMVTMDGHQSADGMQQFRARGIPSDLLSVDRKSDPYDCLKTALYEGRVIFYTYPKLLEELRTLEKNHQTGKVDHPPGGSKDIADALAGLVFSLTEQRPVESLPLAMIQGSAEPTPKALWTDEDSYLRPPVAYDVPAPVFDAPLGGPLPFISGDSDDDFPMR